MTIITPENMQDPSLPQGETLATRTATTLKDGIDSAKDATDSLISQTAVKVDDLHRAVAPKIKAGIDQAQTLVDDGVAYIADTAEAARVKTQEAADVIAAYTREKPFQALLIAAAAGAVLLSLLSMTTRPRN